MFESDTQSPAAPSRQQAIGLLDYLEMIIRGKKIVFYSTALAALVSALISLTTVRIYTATTRILPPQQDSGLLAGMLGQLTGGMANVAGDLLGKGNQSDLHARILATEAIKDAIIDRFKMLEDGEHKQYRIFLYQALDKKVHVSVGKKDGMIAITVDDKDPKRAADIANAYVDELNKLIIRMNLESFTQSRVFIEQQLSKNKVALVEAEGNLKTFQLKNRILDVPGQITASIEEVGKLRAQLAVQEMQLAMLKAQYTDSVQEVIAAKASIEKLRSKIARQEGNGLGGSIPTVGSVPALGEQYVRLYREFKMQEALNEVLTKQYEMAKLSESKQVSTIQVVQKAREPDKSIKPSRRKLVVLSTIVGFLLSVFAVIVREQVDTEKIGQLRRFRRLCIELVGLKAGQE